MELVSIIVPVYNCEKYLERCLNSIIKQTYKNLEILLINDGSTDKSLEIVKEFSEIDNRIIVIDKKNEGVSIARNIGIDNAKGEYITFVDADDWLELDAIDRLYNVIITEKVDVVRGNYYLNEVRANRESIAPIYELSNRKIIKEDFRETRMIEHFLFVEKSIANLVMLLFIRSDVLKKNKVRFNPELYMMEDVVFYLHVFLNIDSIYFMQFPVYHYFYNVNSATKSIERYIKNIKGIMNVNKEIKNILLKNNLMDIKKVSKLNANHLKIITNYLYFLVRDKIYNYKKMIFEIINKRDFQELMKDLDLTNIPMKNKIMINLIRYKQVNAYIVFCKVISVIVKLKNKN
ncbi:MAG: glycosyltransferase [Clostridia bacterium]|nr:glycosyltransferase [Clostridia bacterium]